MALTLCFKLTVFLH